ncbi:unnamed protein product [Boreogadus saida]
MLLLLLLLLLSLSLRLALPLALHVYLSLRLALPQDHRAGRRGREPGYQRGTTQTPTAKYPQPSSRPCRVVLTLLCLPLPRSLGMSTFVLGLVPSLERMPPEVLEQGLRKGVLQHPQHPYFPRYLAWVESESALKERG